MADQEEDYSSLPLTDRATHKIWKVRKQAYEDISKEFEKSGSEGDPCFRPWLNDAAIWKGIVADSNVAAQQEGINALYSFLQFGGLNACLRSRSHTINPLVEKALVSTKAATKAKSLDVLLLYVELDTPSPIVEELLPFLAHKMPKVVAATSNALFSIFREYGAKTVDPKPVLKLLPKLFSHNDKNVRAEAVNITIELYKWLKDGMKPIFFSELKPVQQKELEEAFEKIKGEIPKQNRLLRSQQAALAESSSADDTNGIDTEADTGEPDAFDLFEPVSVLDKIPKDFMEQTSSSKWKDRKESLDALHNIVNVPRIKEEDFTEIVRVLAKSMKDANITVVIVAANCIECLAKGLRGAFARYRTNVFLPVAERLKEKKQTVTDALGAALDGVFNSTSLSDLLEDLIELLKHKNPQVKLESLRFLVRCLQNTRTAPSKPELKMISDAAIKLLADTLEATRTAAAEAMGTLMKIMGERAMNPYMDGLDDIRKSRIKEFFETAQVKAKDKPPAPVAVPAPSTAKAPMKKKPMAKSTTGNQPQKGFAAGESTDEPGSPVKKLGPASKPGLLRPTTTKLAKKPQGPTGAISPRRSVTMPEDDYVGSHTASGIKPLNGGRGGLTSRSLNPHPAANKSDNNKIASDQMTPAIRSEYELLRSEKAMWDIRNSEQQRDKDKLNQELHEIRLQNAQLIEEHTRDVLSIKAKETQLLRLRSDLQTAEEELDKKQREIDRLKRELARFSRANSPSIPDPSETTNQETLGVFPRDRLASSRGLNSEQGQRITSLTRPRNRSSLTGPTSYGGDDAAGMYSRDGLRSPLLDPSAGQRISNNQSGEDDERGGGGADGLDLNENWKRAAQVTSQLKLRIEQMKARQHMRGVS